MSEHALKREAFFRGLKNFYFGRRKKIAYTTDDNDAMQKDWDQTGIDLREAIGEYEQQFTLK